MRESWQVTLRVSLAETLKPWSDALKAVKHLRRDLQAGSLLVGAYRIPDLPHNKRQEACDLFIGHAEGLHPRDWTAALREAVQAANQGVASLATLVKDNWTVATRAVQDGENVQVVARRHTIVHHGIVLLELHAA
jgi:hypothetical protein